MNKSEPESNNYTAIQDLILFIVKETGQGREENRSPLSHLHSCPMKLWVHLSTSTSLLHHWRTTIHLHLQHEAQLSTSTSSSTSTTEGPALPLHLDAPPPPAALGTRSFHRWAEPLGRLSSLSNRSWHGWRAPPRRSPGSLGLSRRLKKRRIAKLRKL